jgi:protease secretion system outer membrane protein
MNLFSIHRACVASWLICLGLAVQAGPLTDAFMSAQRHDPVFQAAKSERDASLSGAQAAGASYYPQFQATYQQLEIENSARQTYAISQPLINADKYASLKEAHPREALAQATFLQREQDLATRLLKVVTDLIKSKESLRLNQSKIDALVKQAESAKKSFELGQGTVTDWRDAQVRLEQARADSLALEVQLLASQRLIGVMTGQQADRLAFQVSKQARLLRVKNLDDYVADGLRSNAQMSMALQNLKLANINTLRADGALLPVLNGVYTTTSNNLATNNYFGLTVSLPLQAASVYQMRAAAANANRSQEQVRDAEEKTRLDIHRYWSLVNAGLKELPIRLGAIDSAQLSVQANEKSFKGGVRSQIDVLNSIQTLFQVQQDHVNAVLNLADNYLNLLLQAATPTHQAIELVQTFLLTDQSK